MQELHRNINYIKEPQKVTTSNSHLEAGYRLYRVRIYIVTFSTQYTVTVIVKVLESNFWKMSRDNDSTLCILYQYWLVCTLITLLLCIKYAKQSFICQEILFDQQLILNTLSLVPKQHTKLDESIINMYTITYTNEAYWNFEYNS